MGSIITKLVPFMQLTRGDEFLVGQDTYEVRALDMPGNGEVIVWATHQGAYHTLYRRTEELAVVPTFG